MTSPEYLKYTASGKNIVITPEMKAKAQEIVGNETNPSLEAQKIYWYIVDTLPDSHAPHVWLDASGTPESAYVLDTGIGDCGSQSMYFAALCRSWGSLPGPLVGTSSCQAVQAPTSGRSITSKATAGCRSM